MVSTLLAKLTRLDADIRRREQHAVAYTEWLRATPGIVQLPTILPRSAETTAVYHVYLIEVEQRDDLVGYLPEHHVETETYYPAPLQLRPCFADLGYVRGDFPRAEAACERAVALPLYPDLTTRRHRPGMRAHPSFLYRYRSTLRRRREARRRVPSPPGLGVHSMTTWVSANGIALRDLVPAESRRQWVTRGWCPDKDLYTLFRSWVSSHPGRTAVLDREGALSYADLDLRVRVIASCLSEAGFGPHDIIGVSVPNGWRAVAAELAVAAVGAVALPYLCHRGRRDAYRLLRRSRASGVITVDVAAGVPVAVELLRLRAQLPTLRTLFVFGAAPAGTRALDRALSSGPASPWSPARVAAEAPARILVSPGSEIEPRMVAYSHNAMAGGRANHVAALNGGTAPMRNLVLVPLASSYGSLGTSITVAALGGTLLLLDAFDVGAALRMITHGRPTHMFAAPTMLGRMATHRTAPDEDVSSLRAVVSSAASLPPDTARACLRRLGPEVINVYASADGVNCHIARKRRADAVGDYAAVPDPRVADIRIVDPAGRDLPAGQPGEIWARGPMTPLCYVNAPELDARYRTPDGWVRTGDRGMLDADGYLHVVGRIKQITAPGTHGHGMPAGPQHARPHQACPERLPCAH